MRCDAMRSRWFGEQMRDKVDKADRSSSFLFWCLENEGEILITIRPDKMPHTGLGFTPKVAAAPSTTKASEDLKSLKSLKRRFAGMSDAKQSMPMFKMEREISIFYSR